MNANRPSRAIHRRVLTASALTACLCLSAAAFAAPDVPPYETGTAQGIPWASGGAGIEARDAMMERFADYNLKLEFAVSDGSYLGDIDVVINQPGGGTMLSALSEGPWFMVKLPAGTYDVQASGYERTFVRTVNVPESGLETVIFNQWTKEGIEARTPSGY